MLRNTSSFWIVVALALSSSLITPSWGRANERVSEFNILPQSLESALLVFAEQADVQVSVSTVVITGMQTQGVVGRFTPSVALARLLSETGLQFSTVGERTYSVSVSGSAKKGPTGGADALEADDASNLRDRVMGLGQGLETGTSAVRAPPEAQQGDSPSSQNGSTYLGETTVTGSRLRRSGDKGPAPVTVFDQQRIKELGVSNVADVLNYLPQQSFSANEQNNFAGSRVVQLRGLGLGTTLVLINGRRTVTSALLGAGNVFDLNTIPLAAVDRIEVLADSASAIYGTDAVGGVVNVILKSDVDRPTFDVNYGTADDGADERGASLALGHSGNRLRGSLALNYLDRGLLLGEDRERFANRDFRRFGSIDARSTLSNPGNITSRTAANLPGLPSRFAAIPEGSTGVGLTPASFLPTAGQRNLESLSRFQSVVPEAERSSAALFSELDINEHVAVFGEFMFSQRDDVRLLSPAFLINATVPAANPFNPFGVPVGVDYLFTGIGPRQEISEAESFRAVGGVRGDIASWDWELSVLSTDEDGSNHTLNLVNTARVNAALAATDPAQALNVFQDGPGGSPTLLTSLIAAPIVDRFSSEALQAGGFVRGRALRLPAGAVEVVVGAETRREEIVFNSASSNVFFRPDRHSSSVYSEIRLPAVSTESQVPLVERLTLTLAGRHDEYSDFGGTFNPQYGLEWSPMSSLLLRASHGTSFRAPSLFELYQPPRVLSTFVLDPRRGNQLSPYTLTLGGNPNLDPEESESWTLGMVFTPFGRQGPEFRAAYWTIQQDQRVQRLSPSLILANESLFPDRVVRDAPSAADVAAGRPGPLLSIAATALNFGRLETSGLDIQITDSFSTAFGVLAPSISATWVKTFDAANFPNTPVIERVGIADTQGTIPDWRVTATLGWESSGFGASITARHVSPYYDVNTLNVPTGRVVASQTLVDAQASVDFDQVFNHSSRLLDGFSIRAGVINLTDEAPNFATVGGSLGYDPVQADVRQRFAYISLVKSF